jgi:hypothetical protein
MDINTYFKNETSLTSIYQEKYEIYSQKIYHHAYIIQDTIDIRNYLEDSFKQKLYSVNDEASALALINQYGTHLFTGLSYGGLMMITNYQVTNTESILLEEDYGIDTKIGTAIGFAQAGTYFSFSEQFTKAENTSQRTSTYYCFAYGGDAVTGMTMDHLFTYNSSMIDGNGNYVYDGWVKSINNGGENLAIVDVPNSSYAIPLWDLLEDDGTHNVRKSYLSKAYAKLCGDKYEE